MYYHGDTHIKYENEHTLCVTEEKCVKGINAEVLVILASLRRLSFLLISTVISLHVNSHRPNVLTG
jgi:hypothetical protein